MNMPAIAEIGHNQPPTELEILEQRLEENYIKEAKEYERLAAVEHPENVDDEKQAGELAEYIKAANGLQKTINSIHTQEKETYLVCGRKVDEWKRGYSVKITALVAKASGPLEAFLKRKAEAERQRQIELAIKAKEEADKLAAEAQAHADAGLEDTALELFNGAVAEDCKANRILQSSDTVKARAVSTFGASASQKFTWVGDIENIAAIDLEKLRKYFSEDSIQKAINAAVRDGVRNISGVKIYEKTTIGVR